ncbi:MAG: prenyltransferase/squalene oxidase repeat-containing protein, partial [Pirellula sp.]
NRTMDWLLACQHARRHPFTGASPGGWGWTNLSGAVPDADDTPAALIALRKWYEAQMHSPDLPGLHASEILDMRIQRSVDAAMLGIEWLLGLQNRDGGWPTFCRGWGALPFDRSGSDLTAHAMRAIFCWRESIQCPHRSGRWPVLRRVDRAIERGWAYLEKHQRPDGSWLPLWFGNQDRPDEDNPVYGTGRVLLGLAECNHHRSLAFRKGVQFLLSEQNPDGSWGGGANTRYPGTMSCTGTISQAGSKQGTIEETSIALEGIMVQSDTTDTSDSILRGLDWLCNAIQASHHHISQPIGFYFARLWYYEKMYPLVFSLSALHKGLQFCQR